MSTTALASHVPAGFAEALASKGLSPGWAKKQPQMWPSPRPRFVPAVWRYRDAYAALTEACAFVSPELAERRNLIMVNPVEDNVYPTCRNLVAAYQLVLPGETARSHRHTPNALRLILDAGGDTFTIVNGVKVDVAEGDVVLTPSWQWHGHANGGDRPAFWIDFLDVPLVQHMENMFFQDHPQGIETPVAHDPDSPLRTRGTDLAARVHEQGSVEIAPHGLKTIALHAIGLVRGQAHIRARRVENTIFAVTAGAVHVTVDGMGEVELARGDVLVVPSWHAFSIHGTADWSQLVRVTDEPVMRALGVTDVAGP